MKNQRIFLRLCEPCSKLAPETGLLSDDWERLCLECRGKIMQSARLLLSKRLQPAAVAVELTEIPEKRVLARMGREELLALLEELRGVGGV